MLPGFVIGLREGLEAALIMGIVLGILRRIGRPEQGRQVWAGVFSAIVVSVAAGILLGRLGVAFEGRAEQIFEGLTMLAAAGVLTWMIFWMRRQGRQTNSALEQSTLEALATGANRMLFGLAFVAVVREGLETALFLTAAAFNASSSQILLGAIAGLALATLLGWAIYAGGKRLNLRAFFGATGLLLLLFAAGLLAHGVHELQEAAILPVALEQLWDLRPILSEESGLGTVLKTLFGYNANPSLLEVLAYGAYITIVVVALITGSRRPLRMHIPALDA
ncbi:MAG: FTR1 family protein [Anaerolineae bacterium]